MLKWETIKIFISSTFRDMHAERDYLVNNVFPELAIWCEERCLHLLDIDLRWGITEADARQKQTVQTCLKNIDTCRPFFICFVGQRLGWVPQQTDVGRRFKELYPDLRDHIGQYSVTQLEVAYALQLRTQTQDGKQKSAIPGSHALFLLREDSCVEMIPPEYRLAYTNDDEVDSSAYDVRLKNFREKITKKYHHMYYQCRWDTSALLADSNRNDGRFTDFTKNGDALKTVILQFLQDKIEKVYPDRKPQKATNLYEQDLQQQSYFMELRAEEYLSRHDDERKLTTYIQSADRKPLLIHAAEGSGKTMLLAYIGKWLASSNYTNFIRFCGISELSGSFYQVWTSVFHQAGITSPDTLSELRTQMAALLLELTMKNAPGQTVLVIDAVDQLSEGVQSLYWLPLSLPTNLRLIISIKSTPQNDHVLNSIADVILPLKLGLFRSFKEKQALMQSFLDKYLKKLDNKILKSICENPASDNPLFLKILLTQLRTFGLFEQLKDETKKYGNSPQEAFSYLLECLETNSLSVSIHTRRVVEEIFGLLSVSRFGLREEELLFCLQAALPELDTKSGLDAIRYYMRLMRPFLSRRNGSTGFLYNSFRIAVAERYVKKASTHNHILFKCFFALADPDKDQSFNLSDARVLDELSYHACMLKERQPFELMLRNYLWLTQRIRLNGAQSAISDYEKMHQKTDDASYRYFQDFLRISSQIINQNIKQIPAQMFSRLDRDENELSAQMLLQAEEQTGHAWLKAQVICLSSPSDALVCILNGVSEIVRVLACQEQVVSLDKENNLSLWGLKDGEKKKNIHLLGAKVTSLHFEGNRFVVGREDGSVSIGSFVDEKEEMIATHLSECSFVFLSGHIVCAGFTDEKFFVFSEKRLLYHSDGFMGEDAFDCCDSHLIFALKPGKIISFDISKKSLNLLTSNAKGITVLTAADDCVCWGDASGTVSVLHLLNPGQILTYSGTEEIATFKKDYLQKFCASSGNTYNLWRALYAKRQQQIGVFDFATGDHHLVVSLKNDLYKENTVKIWSAKTGARVAAFSPLTDAVSCISAQGGFLFIGDKYGKISIWNITRITNENKYETRPPVITKYFSALTQNGLFVIKDDNGIAVYNISNREKIAVIPPSGMSHAGLACDRNHVYIGTGSGMISAWSLIDYQLAFQAAPNTQDISAVAADNAGILYDFQSFENRFDKNGELVGAEPVGTVRMWDTRKDFLQTDFIKTELRYPVKMMEVLRDFLVILSMGKLSVWHIRKKHCVQTIDDLNIQKIVKYSDLLVGANSKGNFYFWQAGNKELTQLKQLKISRDITDFAVDAEYIVTCYKNRIMVQRTADGTLVCTLVADSIIDACFIEHDKVIAVSSGKIMWFDIIPEK